MYLADLAEKLAVDAIYLMDTTGFAIAASDAADQDGAIWNSRWIGRMSQRRSPERTGGYMA